VSQTVKNPVNPVFSGQLSPDKLSAGALASGVRLTSANFDDSVAGVNVTSKLSSGSLPTSVIVTGDNIASGVINPAKVCALSLTKSKLMQS
jgi:hypothetical protein